MSKRLSMTLDDASYNALENMAKSTGSKATAIRDSLQLNYSVQNQAKGGFSRVILQNPKTGAEKELLIPSISSEAE